ncbi:MAG: hypothetical protein ACK4YP_16720 [Myxococcota bacterium]
MFLLALLGCFPEVPEAHTLLDIYHPMLQLNTGSVPGGTEQVQLFLHPELPGVCHPIPTLTATLDGAPMTRLTGKVEGEAGYDRDCAVYEFTVDAATLTPKPTTTIVVTDGTTTLTMEVANLLTPRTMTPSATDVKPGDTVTVAWSPPTDVVDPSVAVGFELEKGDESVMIPRKDVVFGAGSLTFTVPPAPTGQVTVSLIGTLGLQPAVTKCEGAHKCAVSRLYDVAPFTLNVAAP